MYFGLASIIALFLVIILIILRKFIKKIISKNIPDVNGNHHFVEDTLIDTKIIPMNNTKKIMCTNKIYQTTSYNNKNITRYIITENNNDLSLICEYSKKVTSVNVLIYFYNKKKKLIYIYRVEEEVKSKYSKKMNIPRKTSYVNFVDYNEELETFYNKQMIRDRNLLIYDSVSFFLMMYFFSYWTIFIFAKNLVDSYLDVFGILINLILILLMTIINFTINLSVIQKRNPNI